MGLVQFQKLSCLFFVKAVLLNHEIRTFLSHLLLVHRLGFLLLFVHFLSHHIGTHGHCDESNHHFLHIQSVSFNC